MDFLKTFLQQDNHKLKKALLKELMKEVNQTQKVEKDYIQQLMKDNSQIREYQRQIKNNNQIIYSMGVK